MQCFSCQGFFVFWRHTFGKWLLQPQILHQLPRAGQNSFFLRCILLQYLHWILASWLLVSFLSVLMVLMASSLALWSFLICFLVVSLLWQRSIALDRASFRSCNNFFWVALSLILMTSWSCMRESCKQVQKLQVWASVCRAVTYWSIVSFSFFCWLLKRNLSYVSFVLPKHGSWNLFSTISNLVWPSSKAKSMPRNISIDSSLMQERKVAVSN